MKPSQKLIGIACAGCIAVSGYLFSKRSQDNLHEVNPKLQSVATCALQHSTVDFVVVDGGRTEAEHKQNLASGRSWIKHSKHQDGLAIDVAAYYQGKISYDPALYLKISSAFYYCSGELKIPIIWGGEWKVKDLMHYELR